MENQLFRGPGNGCKKPYKTKRNIALFGPKPEKGPQNIEKALPTMGFGNAFSRSEKTLKNQWKIIFFEDPKMDARNLTKQSGI